MAKLWNSTRKQFIPSGYTEIFSTVLANNEKAIVKEIFLCNVCKYGDVGEYKASTYFVPEDAKAERCFNGDTSPNNDWKNNGDMPCWIQMSYKRYDELTQTRDLVVTKYRIYIDSTNVNRAPKSWHFQGSTNGFSWEDIEVRSNVSWTANTWQEFQPSTINVYKHYRLLITESHDSNNNVAINEIQFFNSAGDNVLEPVSVKFRLVTAQYTSPQQGQGLSPFVELTPRESFQLSTTVVVGLNQQIFVEIPDVASGGIGYPFLRSYVSYLKLTTT